MSNNLTLLLHKIQGDLSSFHASPKRHLGIQSFDPCQQHILILLSRCSRQKKMQVVTGWLGMHFCWSWQNWGPPVLQVSLFVIKKTLCRQLSLGLLRVTTIPKVCQVMKFAKRRREADLVPKCWKCQKIKGDSRPCCYTFLHFQGVNPFFFVR